MSGPAAGAPAARGTWREAVAETVRSIPAFADVHVTDVTRLESMSNTTCLVRFGDRRVVVRVPAPGDDPVVDRTTELANTRVAAAAGLAPPVVYGDPGRQLLVTRYVEGPTVSRSALARGDGVERVGKLLARLHRLDACRFRGRFAVATVLDRYRDRLVDDGVRLDVDDAALLRRARRLCRMLDRSAVVAPCHNDPWPANIVDAGDRLVLVDWEYSAVGDPLWDLAHFAVEADLDPDQTDRLLRAWWGRTPPPRVSARLTLWRPLTDVVWGLWARVQHSGGNVQLDLRTYAVRRLRRARHLLDDDAVADAVRMLADVV